MNALLPNLTGHTVSPPNESSLHTEKIADKAMNGIMLPFPGYPEIEFGPNFDWEHEEPGMVTTYQLYMHNLRVVSELLKQYWHSEDVRYVHKASEIVDSWFGYVEAGKSVPMTWYDHAVASRVRTLIYYAYTCQEAGVEINSEQIVASIHKHAGLLMLDENHKMNNHGIMVDHALMCAGFVLENDSYVINGLGRVRAIFWQTYSPRGVHQENSPEYHRMVTKMFRDLQQYLTLNGTTLGDEVMAMLDHADRYPAIIAKPDGKMPQIGDTSSNAASPKILWGSFHDELSGTTVFKHKPSQFYLAFIAGFSQIAHKHSDDLSVLLSSGGVDFFVDAGKYNYGNNKYRRYVVSGKAHSSFAITRGFTKPRDNKLTRKIATDHFLDSKTFNVVSGYNAGYDGAILRRTIYHLPAEGVVLIRDHGSSDRDGEQWFQRFNLHQTVEVESQDRNEYMLSRAGVSVHMRIAQDMETKTNRGNIASRWPTAVNSPVSGKVVPTTQIIASKDGGQEFRNTVVLSMGGRKDVEEYSENGVYRVRVEGREYMLPEFDLYPSEMYVADLT